MAPVVWELKKRALPYKLLFTGQHKELFEDVSDLIPTPDFNLNIMDSSKNLNESLSNILRESHVLLEKNKPSLVLVQGDTTTVLGISLASFNVGIPVGHVEAGLRTHNLQSPFPEEANRQMVSRIATFNWAPTQTAANDLKKEGIQNVTVTGNTVIDACQSFEFEVSYGDKVLITLHRRENFGAKLERMITQLEELAQAHPELKFIFPMHPNPNVQKYRSKLTKVNVVSPLNYKEMIQMMATIKFAISDSGGIQEECAAFKKKVLVCRDTTERPDSIQVGLAKLISTDIKENFDWANESPKWNGVNPYGDGNASRYIVDDIVHYLHEQKNHQHN